MYPQPGRTLRAPSRLQAGRDERLHKDAESHQWSLTLLISPDRLIPWG